MKKLIIITVLAIIAVIALDRHIVYATGSHKEWGEWQYGEWGECIAKTDQCGVNEGYRSREKTRTCVVVNGHGQDQCDISYECPAGFNEPIIGNKCWRITNHGLDFADKIATPEMQLDYEHEDCEIPEETVIKCEEPEEPEPTPTPTATPTPTQVTRVAHSEPAPQRCTEDPAEFAPTVLDYERFNGGQSLRFWVSQTDTLEKRVYYGYSGGELLWNDDFLGLYHEIHQLPTTPLDIKVCSIGCNGDENCGAVVDP